MMDDLGKVNVIQKTHLTLHQYTYDTPIREPFVMHDMLGVFTGMLLFYLWALDLDIKAQQVKLVGCRYSPVQLLLRLQLWT